MKSFKPFLLMALLFCAVTALIACGGSSDTATTETPQQDAPPPAETMAVKPSSWEIGGLKITALTDSPDFPDATLTLPGIEEGQNLPSGALSFAFDVGGYTLGEQTSDAATKGLANSAQGQHIHLIVNNGPYSAHYESSFDKEMEDGHYVVLAFLSRSYHESLKGASAAVLTQLTVGDAGEAESADLTAPHLFYSRPKGTYKGADTEKLMLDFYLANTTLSADGNKVRATINSNQVIFSEWVPYVIEGLPMGEVEITLELIDVNGELIPGPFNSVTRTTMLEPADAPTS